VAYFLGHPVFMLGYCDAVILKLNTFTQNCIFCDGIPDMFTLSNVSCNS